MKSNKVSSLRISLRNVLRHSPGLSIVLAAVILCDILLALIPPLILEKIINQMTSHQAVTLSSALYYFLFIVLSGLCDSAQTVLISKFGQKITHALRSTLCAKLQRLPAEYYTEKESGQTVSLFVNDVDAVGTLFDEGIISMVADACKILGILIVIFTRSTGLGVLLLIVTPLLLWMTRVFQKKMLAAQLSNRAAIARVNNHVPETIQNIRMIRTFSKQQYMEQRYDDYIQESYDSIEKVNTYDSIYSPIILFSSSVVIAVMMVLSSMNTGMQQFFGMSVGSAVAVIAYVNKIFTPLESIGMEIENIQAAAAGIQRINTFLNEPERLIPEKIVQVSSEKGAVVALDHVSFSYTPDEPVLKDLSFQVMSGENITLAGRTGAGKSTIFRLILGLYQPQQGTVRIFQSDAGKISDQQKRHLFGYVEQSLKMVDGTVGEQISLFDPEIGPDQIEKAARLVGIDDVIQKFPQKYSTPCKADLFSQGQLQLLSIARAVAADPVILLLDEITANLDSGTEKMVMAALKRASADRTVISISHRLYEQTAESRLIEI